MLFAHISDTHLGAVPYDIKEREEDFYDTFNEAVERAIKDRVSFVIHSGDIFDQPRPQGTALVRLFDALRKLREREIKFFFTLGEHDISRIRAVPPPILYQRAELAEYIGDGKVHSFNNVSIVGFHKRRKTEVDELKQKLRELDRLENSGKKIIALHQGIYEFHSYAGEIYARDLPGSFDYYAMGHLHDMSVKRFDELRGPVCYPGSTEVTASEGIRDFRKGFFIVDISSEEASTSWIELESARKHFSFDIDYNDIENQINKIIKNLKELRKKPVVKLVVKGKEIDNSKVFNSLAKLKENTLYYQWDVVEENKNELLSYTEKPPDIESEMLRIAESVTGSRELAELAITEILPLLAEDDTEQATELLWKYFKERRKI